MQLSPTKLCRTPGAQARRAALTQKDKDKPPPAPSLISTITMTPSTMFTDSSSMFSAALQYGDGTPRQGPLEGHNEFVFLFNRQDGNPRVYYLMISPHRRGRLLPKVSYVTMTKIKNISGYRVVTLNNMVYIIGGINTESGSQLSTCYRYDPRNNQWLRVASLTRARSRHTANALDGFIYVVGGESKTGRILDTVECYDPVTDCWTEMRHTPKPRADHCACVAGGKLYVTGGLGDLRADKVFWQYDPRSDFWAQAKGLSLIPQGRERHAMVEHKGKLYCTAGLTWVRKDRQVRQMENASVVSFDTKSNADTTIAGDWDRSHPDMRNPRSMAGAVVLGHNIFVLGGFNYTTNENVNTVEYYNIRKKKWYEVFSLGDDNFSSIDTAVVTVPVTNRWFSHLAPAISEKWTLW